MSLDLFQAVVDHVDTGSFILLTWYLMTKWIPAERALEKQERSKLIDQFTANIAQERKAHSEDVQVLQKDYERMVQTEREHFKETLNTISNHFLREIERIESRI